MKLALPTLSPPEALLAAIARLLRPLVRLAMQSGVTFPVFADLLRSMFIDVAASELLDDPKARTDSRISLLTGVHRKEIRRLREAPPPEAHAPGTVTLTSQLIARWLGLPAYVDGAGLPLPLLRASRNGDPSFDALVAGVTRDVRPRAVLDDWLTQGIVALDDDGRVRLLSRAYLPGPGQTEQLFYFARNLHDHVAAASENVMAAGAPPFLDRSVHYDALTDAEAEQLQALAREAAQQLLVEVNKRALAIATSAPPRPGEARRRVNLGVYLYATEDDATPEQESGA